ncbi:MAG: pantetheine-phosphate adenylyltransferase [Deltaproteobacteria bacterium]|nr:pantetheine-phosphate adenylyltransferase [Deltaproteobacteria bacterium]
MRNNIIAVYPGSFCPPTIGHTDVVVRAAAHYDKLIWAIGVNSAKKCFLTVSERLDMLRRIVEELRQEGLNNIEVDSFEGSAIRYAERIEASFILRGLRNTSDLQFELDMATANRGISKKIETVCMFSKPHYATLSSSMVTEIAILGEKIDQYVHPYVARQINKKLGVYRQPSKPPQDDQSEARSSVSINELKQRRESKEPS